MSLFPRRTIPGGTVIVHVRLERTSGAFAPWALETTLTGPDGGERARFTARGEMAPGAGRIDRWFAWCSRPDDPLGRYDANLIAAIGDVVVDSSTSPDDHIFLERLERDSDGLHNPGPTPVPACFFIADGSVLAEPVLPAFTTIDVPARAAFATWADGRLLALRTAGSPLYQRS